MPEYIGKPPPWLLKRKLREISPEVPDPEPATPPRNDVFGTPARSGRITKTYAHKRARSYASSAAEEPEDGDDVEGSGDSSPEISPTKPSKTSTKRPTTAQPSRSPSKRSESRRRKEHEVEGEAGRSNARRSSPSASPRRPRRKSFSAVYVELPRGERTIPEPLPASSSAGPSRGRPRQVKAIEMPTPSTSSEEGPPPPSKPRTRAPSSPELSLSEALNRSFAATSDMEPVRDGANSATTAHIRTHDAGPSSVSVKRKPGRPRGRGRGITGPGQTVSRSTHTPTKWTSISPVRPTRTEGAESTDEEPAALVPAKRPRGRPRKNPLPETPINRVKSARSVSRGRQKAAQTSETPASSQNAYQSVDVAPVAQAFAAQAIMDAQHLHTDGPASPLPKRGRGRPRGSKNKTTLARERTAVSAGPSSRVALPVSLSANPIVETPPAKRPRGRPRKSAPTPSIFPASDTFDYMEPLKDPDAEEHDETAPGPSTSAARRAKTPMPRGRSRSRARADADGTSTEKEEGAPGRSVSTARAPQTPVRRGRTRSRSRARAENDGAGPSHSADDKDDENVPGPATPATKAPQTPLRRGRSRSRARADSDGTGASIPPPSYYLDMTTLQWRPRARSVSKSPSKRRPVPAEGGKAAEYQSCSRLCAALKSTLLKAPTPKTTNQGKANVDEGLRVASSGVLLLADEEEEGSEGRVVFCGSWTVLADPKAACDDGLALKTLHEIVKGLDTCINLDTTFSHSEDGRTVTVAVPCGCLSITERHVDTRSQSLDRSDPPQCAGEMTVSVGETQVPDRLVGVAKALRMTVTVVH